MNNILGEVVIEKSVKFSKKILMDVNYLIVDPDKWTIKEDNNNLVKLLIQNYVRKYNELYGEYRRNLFSVTVGDELQKVFYSLRKSSCKKRR